MNSFFLSKLIYSRVACPFLFPCCLCSHVAPECELGKGVVFKSLTQSGFLP